MHDMNIFLVDDLKRKILTKNNTNNASATGKNCIFANNTNPKRNGTVT